MVWEAVRPQVAKKSHHHHHHHHHQHHHHQRKPQRYEYLHRITPAETETQQVWDFAGDGFVHRLIRNKADGKLVEISDPGQTSGERPQIPARLSDVQV